MAYNKTAWVNDSLPPINDDNLNNLENGVANMHSVTDTQQTKLDTIEVGAKADQTKAEIDALQINSKTVNGHTVDTDVPVNAEFTDTKDHTQLANIGSRNHTEIDTALDNALYDLSLIHI